MDLDRSPLTLAEQSRQLVTAGLRRGLPIAEALQAAGVPRRTWDAWRKVGEDEIARCAEEGCDPEPHLAPFVEFVETAMQSRAEGAMVCLERIWAAAENDWRAAAWMLERSMPTIFGRRTISTTIVETETITRIDPSDGISLMTERIAQIEARVALAGGAIDTTGTDVTDNG